MTTDDAKDLDQILKIVESDLARSYAKVEEIYSDLSSRIEELEKVMAAISMGYFELASLVDGCVSFIVSDDEDTQNVDQFNDLVMKRRKEILEMAENAGATGVAKSDSESSPSSEPLVETNKTDDIEQ